MINGKKFLGVLILILIVTNSCRKDEPGNMPALPPVTSISIEFPFMTSQKNGSVNLTNWEFSTVSLALWNTLLNKNCAIPVTSFEKSVEQSPVYMEHNTWKWSYRYSADSVLVFSRLQGKLANDSADWKLFVATSKDNITSDEFKWIEGKSASDQSGGWWLIYEKPSSPEPYLKIFWSQHGDENTNRLVYLKPGDPDTGHYLEYGTRNSSVYDTYYNIELHNGNSIAIELNKTSKDGRIRSMFLYNDSLWHCWNSSFGNVDCNN